MKREGGFSNELLERSFSQPHEHTSQLPDTPERKKIPFLLEEYFFLLTSAFKWVTPFLSFPNVFYDPI